MSEGMGRDRLGPIGIWSIALRYGDPGEAVEAAAELDELGFGAIWFPGGHGGDIEGDSARLLEATRRTTVATGILNIWMHEPEAIANWWNSLPSGQQHRMFLGLGVSHADQIGESWGRPVATMRDYLDRLSAAGLPSEATCLAALGPKMLELARDRTAGAHPYLVTPEHTALAREIMGDDALLAPEQGVILESDPARARELAREALQNYLHRPNYCNSWRRLGFSEDDIAHQSDRLIDGLFAWGGMDEIAQRVRAHQAAGADHVCLQVVTGGGTGTGALRKIWRELAAALL